MLCSVFSPPPSFSFSTQELSSSISSKISVLICRTLCSIFRHPKSSILKKKKIAGEEKIWLPFSHHRSKNSVFTFSSGYKFKIRVSELIFGLNSKDCFATDKRHLCVAIELNFSTKNLC